MNENLLNAGDLSTKIESFGHGSQLVTPETSVVAPASELIELCSTDRWLFCSEFFPKTVRQSPAIFHDELWMLLESSARQVAMLVFRGGAKTTMLRLFMAKRLAYGLARTILYIAVSQEKAIQSVTWLRGQIENNRKFTDVYRLSKGKKWQDVHCTINHGIEDYEAHVLAYGLTGSVRGVNLDDHRPDLIIVDDILDDENTATPEQRLKVENLLYGAILASLAPASEVPDAKLVMLQTPLNKEDSSIKAMSDPSWVTARHGCWTKETERLSDSDKESVWEERFSTQTLRDLKKSYLARNQASVWTREYEVKVTSPETACFKAHWLRFYELPPEGMQVVGVIDPVPPPTEKQIAQGMKGKDYEVLLMVGFVAGRYYLLEYSMNRGHEPNWTVAEFFRLSMKWNPRVWAVETVAYQKTLQWILREAMKDRAMYYPVRELDDSRSKFDRINDSLAGPTSNGAVFIKPHHSEFISQFTEYPDVTHDDVLDAMSMAIMHRPLFLISSDQRQNQAAMPQNNVIPIPHAAQQSRRIIRQGAP